ncbi:MAG: hypothetical protein RLN89_07875 [Parvibaculum sp.]
MRLFNFLFITLFALPFAFIFAFQNGLLDGLVDEDLIPVEPFIKAELAGTVTPEEIDLAVNDALDKDAYEDALMYADIADYAAIPMSIETRQRLIDAGSLLLRVSRDTGSFFEGFLTGEGSDTAGFMGAITSDLTVVGDLRDIGEEGSKLVAGEDYSELILGLSVVGVAATGATIASGGSALPVKVGVSLMKIAKRTGALTRAFARQLGDLVRASVNFSRLRRSLNSADLANNRTTRRTVTEFGKTLDLTKLTPVLDDMASLQRTAGPAESIRLLSRVESVNDLRRVTRMSSKLGTKTRGIMTLTGKTSLRAFKTVANLVLMMLQWVWAIAAGLLTLFLGMGARRTIRRVRRA